MATRNVLQIIVDAVVRGRSEVKALSEGLDTVAASAGKADKALGGLETASAGVGDAAARAGTGIDALGVSAREATAAIDGLSLSEKQAKSFNDQLILSNLNFSKAIEASRNNLTKFQSTLTRIEGMGTPAVMRTATWAALGVGGIVYESIKKYADFNSAITQSVTQAGRSIKDLPFLSAQALKISQQTGQSMNDVANAIYRVSSGTASWNHGLGASKKQLMEITKQVSQLTVLGNVPAGAQQEQAARVISAIVNANVKGVGRNIGKAAALVNAAVGSGDIRMSELTTGMGRGVLTAAKVTGASIQDTMSYIDLLTSQGMTGPVAGNYVKTALMLLSGQSQQGTKAAEMVGVKAGDLGRIMRDQGIAAAASYLMQHMTKFNPPSYFEKYKGAAGFQGAKNLLKSWTGGAVTDQQVKDWQSGVFAKPESQLTKTQRDELYQFRTMELMKMFGGAKQLIGIATLLENIPAFQGIRANIDRNANQRHYQQMVQIAENQPKVQFRKEWNKLMADLISIGKAITPAAVEGLKLLVKVFDFLLKFKPLLGVLVASMGGLLAMAGASKAAGLMKGAYALIGGALVGKDKVINILGRIIHNKGMRDYIGSGGAGFRADYRLKALQAEAASGKIFLQAGETFTLAVDKFSGAVTEQAMTGGAGGAAGRAVKSVEKVGEKQLLSAEEHAVLSKFAAEGEMAGRKFSPTAVREAMGLSDSRKNRALAKEMFGRLEPHVTASGRITEEGMAALRAGATGEAVAGAETAAIGTGAGIVEGAAGRGLLATMLGDTVGGLMGGPIGMIAMTGMMMAAPSILRALGGLFSDSKPQKPVKPVKPQDVINNVKKHKTKLYKAQQKLQADLAAGWDTKTISADIARVDYLQNQAQMAKERQKRMTGQSGFEHYYQQHMLLSNLRGRIKRGMTVNEFYKKYKDKLPANLYAEVASQSVMRDPVTGKAVLNPAIANKLLGAYDKGDLSVLQSTFKGYLLGRDKNWFNRATEERRRRSQEHTVSLLSRGALDPSHPLASLTREMNASVMAAHFAASDRALAQKSTGAVKAAYLAEATKQQQLSDKLRQKGEAFAEKHKQQLDPQTIAALALQIGGANKKAMEEIGMTPDSFAAAFVSALVSGKTKVANIINSANTSNIIYGGS